MGAFEGGPKQPHLNIFSKLFFQICLLSSATKGCGGVKGTRVAIMCILPMGILNVSILLFGFPPLRVLVPFGAPCRLSPVACRLSPVASPPLGARLPPVPGPPFLVGPWDRCRYNVVCTGRAHHSEVFSRLVWPIWLKPFIGEPQASCRKAIVVVLAIPLSIRPEIAHLLPTAAATLYGSGACCVIAISQFHAESLK